MCRTPTVLIFRYKMCSTVVKIRQKWIGFLYRYIICCPQKRFKLRIPFTLGIKAIRSWTCFVRSLYISFYQVCLDGRNIYKEPKVTQWYNRVNTICKKSTKSETLFLIGMAFEKVSSEKRMGMVLMLWFFKNISGKKTGAFSNDVTNSLVPIEATLSFLIMTWILLARKKESKVNNIS